MAFTMLSLLPFLFMIFIVFFFFRSKKPRPSRINIRLGKRWHYIFLSIYIAILLVATVFAESMEATHGVSLSEKPAYVEFIDGTYDAIKDNTEIDPSKIAIQRTHPIGNELTIENLEYSNMTMLIERKNVNDGIVEEVIYLPTFVSNDRDFSSEIRIREPEWTTDTMAVHTHPFPVIKEISYHDSQLLNQFAKVTIQQSTISHASSSSLIVHLIVPKDLVIHATYEEQIEYITR